jgi:hypothetical protein
MRHCNSKMSVTASIKWTCAYAKTASHALIPPSGASLRCVWSFWWEACSFGISWPRATPVFRLSQDKICLLSGAESMHCKDSMVGNFSESDIAPFTYRNGEKCSGSIDSWGKEQLYWCVQTCCRRYVHTVFSATELQVPIAICKTLGASRYSYSVIRWRDAYNTCNWTR